MIPFYIDGKWVTRILQLKYQHLNLGYFYCNNCKAQYTVHQTLSNDLQIQYTPCNELQELGRNAQIVLCNKETRGGGALIETIFHCSWAASGRKRGKHVLSHMECYNGTRLKTAMSNCIPALVPAGHSSFSVSLLLWEFTFYVPLSISKCSQNECPLRQLCNYSGDEVSLHTSTIEFAAKWILFP